MYDLALLIGRFQIPHEGVMRVIEAGLAEAARVAVLIGSSGAPRSHRNPFTYDERRAMLMTACPTDRLSCVPLEDFLYNDELWMTQVRESVARIGGVKVALIGNSLHRYAEMFPEWDTIEIPAYPDADRMMTASSMREAYFSNVGHMWLNDCDGHRDGDTGRDRLVPTEVQRFLTRFIETPDYRLIRQEYEYCVDYLAQYSGLPYRPVFVTADACVIQSGYVLLVRRKNFPGKGQWAFPGGFVKPHQTILEAMLAELSEETTIGVDRETVLRSIIHKGEYDDPNRDPRGRVITHAFLVHLKRSRQLPDIRGADDAVEARWMPLNAVKRDMMFLDHNDILRSLVGRI